MSEKKEKENNIRVKDILEQIHVHYLDDQTVELTHGVDKCVRKVHKFPQHLRGEE